MKDPFSLDRIARVDTKDVRSTYERWPSLAKDGFRVDVELPRRTANRAYVLGMGGSASGGDIIAGWMFARGGAQLEVFKGHILAGDMTGSLAVACSASGQTEETIDMTKEAIKRHATVVAISAGGELKELAERLGAPHIQMPKVIAPRYMLPFIVFSTLAVLNIGLDLGCESEAEESFIEMESEKSEVRASSTTEANPSKSLAAQILEKTPAVYGARVVRGAGVRFKNVLNENAKMHSHFDGIPDTFHNEIEAWEDPRGDFLPIFLRHSAEDSRDGERTDVMISILEKYGKNPVQQRGRGRSSLSQLITLVYRLDMAAYYAAVGLGRDPFPTTLIDELKNR
jgi:glucose/mannose-6-phosphate isomerase